MDLTPFHGPPAAPPSVPGFAARTLLGFGTHGEVWRADDLTTGAAVALKIGRPAGPGPEAETALLCRIDHPHIVRLQRVVPLPEGGLAMVLDLASGGSLASLVAARGRFDPGEVSTLLVPLAGALEHLHERGVVHGDLAPGNVLFTADGRPQLGDLGVARVLGTRTGEAWATPGFTDPVLTGPGGADVDPRAVDRWGLAALGWFALTGRPPDLESLAEGDDRAPALAAVLAQCLGAAPDDRPPLLELSDRAWQAARPTPIRLVPLGGPIAEDAGLPPLSSRLTRPVPIPAPGPGEPGSGEPGSEVRGAARAVAAKTVESRLRRTPASRTRTGVRALVIAGAAITVGGTAAAVAVAATMTGLPPAPGDAPEPGPAAVGTAAMATTTPVASPSGTAAAGLEAELTRALKAIGRSRAAAFSHASARFLNAADVSGSPAYLEDLGLVQRLRARGYRLEGVRYAVSGVQVLQRRGELVDVRVVVTTSRHRQVRVSSGTALPVPADGPRSVVLTVAPVDRNVSGPARWRVRDVAVAR